MTNNINNAIHFNNFFKQAYWEGLLKINKPHKFYFWLEKTPLRFLSPKRKEISLYYLFTELNENFIKSFVSSDSELSEKQALLEKALVPEKYDYDYHSITSIFNSFFESYQNNLKSINKLILDSTLFNNNAILNGYTTPIVQDRISNCDSLKKSSYSPYKDNLNTFYEKITNGFMYSVFTTIIEGGIRLRVQGEINKVPHSEFHFYNNLCSAMKIKFTQAGDEIINTFSETLNDFSKIFTEQNKIRPSQKKLQKELQKEFESKLQKAQEDIKILEEKNKTLEETNKVNKKKNLELAYQLKDAQQENSQLKEEIKHLVQNNKFHETQIKNLNPNDKLNSRETNNPSSATENIKDSLKFSGLFAHNNLRRTQSMQKLYRLTDNNQSSNDNLNISNLNP